jgi:hypothetical protein
VFRDQIYGAVDGINKSIQSTFKTIIDLLALNLKIIGKAVYGAVDGINKGIQSAIKGVWDWASNAMGNVAKALVRPFEIAANSVKEVFRGVLQFVADRVNTAAALVNNIIDGYNRIPVAPDLPRIPIVQVPSFEGGGYTGNAPRSGGLDGRGGFMAMVHPRETIIDHTRAAAGGSGGGGPNITIPITVGHVVQLADGTDTVTMGEFQAGLQTLANGIMSQLRSPSGRMALRGA